MTKKKDIKLIIKAEDTKPKAEESKSKGDGDNWMEEAWRVKQALIPKDETFTVVGIDEHELPEDALYFIGNFDTEAEAHTKQKEVERKGVKAHIYDKNTK